MPRNRLQCFSIAVGTTWLTFVHPVTGSKLRPSIQFLNYRSWPSLFIPQKKYLRQSFYLSHCVRRKALQYKGAFLLFVIKMWLEQWRKISPSLFLNAYPNSFPEWGLLTVSITEQGWLLMYQNPSSSLWFPKTGPAAPHSLLKSSQDAFEGHRG